jgi:hypothetical protein
VAKCVRQTWLERSASSVPGGEIAVGACCADYVPLWCGVVLQVMMKPGGHGVLWKLMIDQGVFDWLAARGRQAAIVRQIRSASGGLSATAGQAPCVRADLLSQLAVGDRWLPPLRADPPPAPHPTHHLVPPQQPNGGR